MGHVYDREYDPYTGMTHEYIDEGDGSITIRQKQDLSGAVEFAKDVRNTPSKEKENWRHYAVIPALVLHDMYKAKIDVAKDPKAVFQFINKNYPALKVTDRWHDDRRAKKDGRIIVK